LPGEKQAPGRLGGGKTKNISSKFYMTCYNILILNIFMQRLNLILLRQNLRKPMMTRAFISRHMRHIPTITNGQERKTMRVEPETITPGIPP
jgi:hypothetical protein